MASRPHRTISQRAVIGQNPRFYGARRAKAPCPAAAAPSLMMSPRPAASGADIAKKGTAAQPGGYLRDVGRISEAPAFAGASVIRRAPLGGQRVTAHRKSGSPWAHHHG